MVIHSGSRNLGAQIANFYIEAAYESNHGTIDFPQLQLELVNSLKAQNRHKEIQSAIIALKKEYSERMPSLPKELCYLTGENRQYYLDDMGVCQRFAVNNRRMIASRILELYFGKHFEEFDSFETIHNYIDLKNRIVRKGAVSAAKGEKLLIPINMRDGALICVGKGNEDWNCSAPHGAGRLLSRKGAKKQLDMEEFRKRMEGVYTTCVDESTLDESPMAYKDKAEIIECIAPTAQIVNQIKPIYNFKASDLVKETQDLISLRE